MGQSVIHFKSLNESQDSMADPRFSLLLDKIFSENFMKMKEIGPGGGISIIPLDLLMRFQSVTK